MAYPVAISRGAAPASIGADLARKLFDSSFSGFSGGLARFLKPRKADFVLSGSGGSKTIMPNGSVLGVLLAVAPYNHCTWYRNDYQPGQEPARPDLQWIQRDPNAFPDALPAQFRQKVMKNGRMVWDFRTARRSVWALCSASPAGSLEIDLDNPVILDMTSMSMFGKGDPATHSYKWTGMQQFCLSMSGGGVMVSPQMFVTQINIDLGEQVSGVVVFKPADAQGNVLWLDEATLERVAEASQSELVQGLVTVNEILGETDAPAAEGASDTARDEAMPAEAAPRPRPSEEARTAATPPAGPAARTEEPARQMSVLERARLLLDGRKGEGAPAQAAPVAAPPASDGGVKDELLSMLNALGG